MKSNKMKTNDTTLHFNAYYMLAWLHFMKKNLKMAFKYTELAEDAEKKRLPFLPSVDLPEKHDMLLFFSGINAICPFVHLSPHSGPTKFGNEKQ
jgi:hypothetical protein